MAASPRLARAGRSYLCAVRRLSGVASFSPAFRSSSRGASSTTCDVASSSAAENPADSQPPLTEDQKVVKFLEKALEQDRLLAHHIIPFDVTVEAMQERVDYLKELGISKEAMSHLIFSTIEDDFDSVVSHLNLYVCSFSFRKLCKVVQKCPRVLGRCPLRDLKPVEDYLKSLGIKDIYSILIKYPDLYLVNYGHMCDIIDYIVSLGVTSCSVGHMLAEYPEVILGGMYTIKPKVDFLLSCGISKPVVAKLLEEHPYILRFDISDNMQRVVNDLSKAGVKEKGIANIITMYPDILGQCIRENLLHKTNWLVHQLEVKPKDVPVVLEKLPQILFIKEGLAMERVEFFRNVGCSVKDVAKMVTSCPQILALSITHVLKPSLDYLLQDMKWSVKEIVKFPFYFIYDLKSVIMPRCKLIADKDVKRNLEWFLNCTDQRFTVRLSGDDLDDDEPRPAAMEGGRKTKRLQRKQIWDTKLQVASVSDIECLHRNEGEPDIYYLPSYELHVDTEYEDDDGYISFSEKISYGRSVADKVWRKRTNNPYV